MSERSVDENDYNQLRTKIANILGNGFSDRGYGQTLVSLEAQEGSVISINQWKELTEDLSNTLIHQTGSIPSVPNFDSNTTITLSDLNQIETLVNTLDSNRFFIGTGRSVISAKAVKSISIPWSQRAQAILTITFETSDRARHFFNSGGLIRFSSSRSGGTDTPQNGAWTNILNSAASVDFKAYNSLFAGFYNLNNQYKTVYQKNLSTPYSSNYYRIEATVNTNDNSTGSASQITFRITWEDSFAGVSDKVDGRLQIDVSQLLPSGPLNNDRFFTISEPDYNLQNITLTGQPNKVYSLTKNKLSASAVNDSFTITLNTINVPDGEAVPYTITGVNSNEIGNSPLTSSFVVFDNQATKTFATTSSDYVGVPNYIPQPVPVPNPIPSPIPVPVPVPNPIPVPVDVCQEFVVIRQDINDRNNWTNVLDLSNSAAWTIGLPNHQSVARYFNYPGMLDPKTEDTHPVSVFGINASVSTIASATNYERFIATKNPVNVSDISQFVFKINKGTESGWGQVPEKNSGTAEDEALELQYSSDNRNWITLERYTVSEIPNDVWIEKSVNVPSASTITTIVREFPYAEGIQTFVVPDRVTSLDITMYSGAGGGGGYNTPNGQDGQGRQKITFTLPVTPLDIISVYTGGGGEGGESQVAGIRNTSEVIRSGGARFLTAQGGKSYPGYEGGQGGRPGSYGASGAAGGGGGATVLLKNNVITAIAGGGGGGAGAGASSPQTHNPETTYRTSTQSTKGGDGFDRGNLAGVDGGGSGGGGGGSQGGLGGASGGNGDPGGYRGSRGTNLIPSGGQFTQDVGGGGSGGIAGRTSGGNGTNGSMTITYQISGSPSQSIYLRYYQKGNQGSAKKADTWAMTTIKGKPKSVLPVRTVFKICPRSLTVNEGSSLVFDVTAQGFGTGKLYATLNSSTVTSADFTTGTTSYTVDILNDRGTFTLSFKEDKITEGDALFFMELRENSTTGTVVARSPSVTLYDTSTKPAPVPTQAISADFTTEYNGTTNYTEFKLTVTGPGYGTYRYALNSAPNQNFDTTGTFDNPAGGNLVWSVISGNNTRATFRVKAPHKAFNVTATVTREGLTPYTKTLQIPERVIPKQKKEQSWSSGSGTWTVPAGVTSVSVTAIGGGAGGASGSEANPYVSGGGGGSSGGFNQRTISVTPGQKISYSVGKGGAGAAKTTGGSVKNGSAGARTSFGTVVAAGGNPPNTGYSNHFNQRGLAPEGGISGTDGQVVKGSAGKLGSVVTSGGRGGGIPGYGTGGAEGTVSQNNGQAGSGYGAGGGGGFGQSGGSPPQGGGGAGTNGYIKIEWEE